jgi:hypothetical protein
MATADLLLFVASGSHSSPLLIGRMGQPQIDSAGKKVVVSTAEQFRGHSNPNSI